jgi:DNA invertase Pin-like site-specific DNA recombinase
MNGTAHEKVNACHLKRNAYLYVRQSTLRQVLENTESTIRQYDLRQRAVALGWPIERIIVIDSDLGQSAATAADREGFQKLVTEVSLEKAGNRIQNRRGNRATSRWVRFSRAHYAQGRRADSQISAA